MANDNQGGKMRAELQLVRELAQILHDSDLSEIEVQDGDRAVRVARQMAAAMSAAPAQSFAPPPPSGMAPSPLSPREHPGTVKSPMVGTAYLSAEPGAAPYVAIGATVKEGDTLLIVEAMKVMNPITAPRAGTLKAMLVENEQPVEYDQPLAIIE
jgi:acetyl-CoA carboxylase biotin carboxyl carrier protein